MMMNMMAEQNLDLKEEFINMRQDVHGAFQQLGEDLQDTIDSVQEEIKQKDKSTKAVLANLMNKLDKLIPMETGKQKRKDEFPENSSQSEVKPEQKYDSKPKDKAKPAAIKTEYLCKLKILYIRDSIGKNINTRKVEIQSKSRIFTSSAYSSVQDSISSEDKTIFILNVQFYLLRNPQYVK